MYLVVKQKSEKKHTRLAEDTEWNLVMWGSVIHGRRANSQPICLCIIHTKDSRGLQVLKKHMQQAYKHGASLIKAL